MRTFKFHILLPALSLCVVMCASCVNKPTSGTAGGDLVTVDIAADHPKEKISIQSIAEVEYVPLAISDEVLLSDSDRIFYLSDDYIMVHGRRLDEIFVFNRKGEIVSHFNRRGRGPNEYTYSRSRVLTPAFVRTPSVLRPSMPPCRGRFGQRASFPKISFSLLS